MAEETPKQEESGFGSVFNQFMDHQRRAMEESSKALDALFPDAFKEHGAVARDEFRKGLKVVVDYTIDELEKLTKDDDPGVKQDEAEDEEPPQSTTGRTKVKVQVE